MILSTYKKEKNANGKQALKKLEVNLEVFQEKLDFSVTFSNKKTLCYDDVAARRVYNEFLLTGKSSCEDRSDKKA